VVIKFSFPQSNEKPSHRGTLFTGSAECRAPHFIGTLRENCKISVHPLEFTHTSSSSRLNSASQRSRFKRNSIVTLAVLTLSR
jgi:hypothetical protein